MATSKAGVDRQQRILLDIVQRPGNDVCADCKRHAPRWASHNLGIFLCVTCGSVHRKIGTHVSKVKSLTLDSWTKEQVEHMKATGNIKSNQYYNPDERRNPPPANLDDADRGSDLEVYIRAKYESKKFLAPGSLQARPASTSASSFLNLPQPPRSKSTPITHPAVSISNPSRASSRTPFQKTPLPTIPQAQLPPADKPTPPPKLPSFNLRPQDALGPRPIMSPPPAGQLTPQRTGLSNNVLSDMMSIQSPISASSSPFLSAASGPSQLASPFASFPATGSNPYLASATTLNGLGTPLSTSSSLQPSPFNQNSISPSQTSPYGGLSQQAQGTPAYPSSFPGQPPPFQHRSVSLPVQLTQNSSTLGGFTPSPFQTPAISGAGSPFGLGVPSLPMQATNTSNPFLQMQQPQQPPAPFQSNPYVSPEAFTSGMSPMTSAGYAPIQHNQQPAFQQQMQPSASFGTPNPFGGHTNPTNPFTNMYQNSGSF